MSFEEIEIEEEEEEINHIAPKINNSNFSDKSSVGKLFFQIDVLKTVCIILVVQTHTFGRFFPIEFIWQVINPVNLFFIIMGFNYGNSFKKRNLYKLSDMYSFLYFKRMFWRLIFPLLLINLISFIIDLISVSFTGYHIHCWAT